MVWMASTFGTFRWLNKVMQLLFRETMCRGGGGGGAFIREGASNRDITVYHETHQLQQWHCLVTQLKTHIKPYAKVDWTQPSFTHKRLLRNQHAGWCQLPYGDQSFTTIETNAFVIDDLLKRLIWGCQYLYCFPALITNEHITLPLVYRMRDPIVFHQSIH